MLTNLLVSIVVTIATNTTEYISRWEKSVPTWPHYQNIVNGQQHSDAPIMENWGPLEKVVTLECVKTTEALTDYLGKPKVLWTEQETLWRTNIYLKCERVETWKRVLTNNPGSLIWTFNAVTNTVITAP